MRVLVQLMDSPNTTRDPGILADKYPDFSCRGGIGEIIYRRIPRIYALTGQVKDPIMRMFFNRLISRFFSIDYAQSIYLIL